MSDTTLAPVRPAAWWRPYVPVVVVMALLTLLPHVGLSNRHVHLSVVCLIWAMAAFGLFVPYAFAGQMTVAVVTAWGVGAFSTALAIEYWDWGFVPNLLFSMAAAFVAGALMAMPILRTKGHYFVIITFVLAEAVTVAANNWEVTSGPGGGGISVSQPIEFLGFSFAGRISMYYLCLAAVTIMALTVVWLRGSRLGKHFASIRENEELARSIGVSTTWLKILALAIGGIFAGAAGTFYAYYLSHIDIRGFGVNQAITLILIVVVGGRQAILGPLVGAAVAYYLPELIQLDPNRVLIGYGVVLGLMVIFLPTGILGGLDSAWKRWQRRRRQPQPSEAPLLSKAGAS